MCANGISPRLHQKYPEKWENASCLWQEAFSYLFKEEYAQILS